MYYLGLAFAERAINTYIYDLKPSVNAPHTTYKFGETFVNEVKPLLEN